MSTAAAFVAPTIDWAYLVPVIVVLGAGVLGVLVEAFVPDRHRRAVQVVLALGALVGALTTIVLLWDDVQELNGIQVLGGSLVIDPFGLALQGIVVVLALLATLVIADRTSTGQDAFAPTAAAVPGSAYEDLARRRGLEQTEVFPLVLFAVGGMMIFPATGDLLTMFVALEVLSLPLYVLTALARRRRLLSQEASFKYFLLGAFASAIFIFGVALVYGFAGSVRLAEVRAALLNGGGLDGMTGLVLLGLVMVLAGLLFKIGAAPFHSWTPDVYQGAPTPITGFMAACTKAAAFGALVRVLYLIGSALPPDLQEKLVVALWVVAILTMVVGSVIGVIQTDMKRLLAYSSIAHAGFLLVALVGFGELSGFGVRAVVFYLLAYGLATVGAFAVVTLVRERSPQPRAAVESPVLAAVGSGGTAGSVAAAGSGAGGAGDLPASDGGAILGEATHLTEWAGLGRRSPWLAGAFALFLLSMAGIPLTAGFIAKFTAFGAAVAVGAWPLALIGVLASAVSVFFYVRIIVLMFFTPSPSSVAGGVEQESPENADGGPAATSAVAALATRVTVVRSEGFTTVAIVICVTGVVLLGVLPSSVLDLALEAAKFRP
ncbi:NADH-quinone oxidoreductase subunit NuoN [Oerskovia sp. Root22]|uniref:NADH-quinone oxidoreductase subunit NuoN n=1 Tax=Oerskovia sp. Root22 TaxID=1736494 RepID=UPI0006FD87D8|nr:NADH-quinone oxidoreductase subunit NuoN [Oerskovia sp. Root22]KRC37112.1 NADH-quinone oxidoreductase subunit N [Oerskovia sp. Root22]